MDSISLLSEELFWVTNHLTINTTVKWWVPE